MNRQEITKLRQDMIIAKMIYDPEFRANVYSLLEISDFPDRNYQIIYREIRELTQRHEAVDALKLNEVVPDIELPIRDLAEQDSDYFGLARTLHKNGYRFRVLMEVQNFLDKSDTFGSRFEDELKRMLDRLAEPEMEDFGLKSGSDIMAEFMEHLSHKFIPIARTGIREVDYIVRDMEEGHIYTIVAGSGVGKTMMGVQIFEEGVKMGTHCLYLSNEMSALDISSRLVARRAGISSTKLKRGLYEGYENVVSNAVGVVAEEIDGAHSFVVDNMSDIHRAINAIRYHCTKDQIRLVVVDHINNFRGTSDYEGVAYVAHELQMVSQQMNVAIVILAQISMASQKSGNIEMVTAKGAKDIEEVSNVMIVLNRNKIQMEESLEKDKDPNIMKISVTKNRDGETGYTYARIEFPNMVLTQDE